MMMMTTTKSMTNRDWPISTQNSAVQKQYSTVQHRKSPPWHLLAVPETDLVVSQHGLDLFWLCGGWLRRLHVGGSSSCGSKVLSNTAGEGCQGMSE
jgi:hypothetical protein